MTDLGSGDGSLSTRNSGLWEHEPEEWVGGTRKEGGRPGDSGSVPFLGDNVVTGFMHLSEGWRFPLRVDELPLSFI